MYQQCNANVLIFVAKIIFDFLLNYWNITSVMVLLGCDDYRNNNEIVIIKIKIMIIRGGRKNTNNITAIKST
jgi:hypothetical protein